ncbi:hypothetical protein QPK87_08475 [Kamptonema cortianum]|uniref:Uncharacterized protein n=1 Tax=Geitlerinema calcuttense NRMC-F 0142 TaxID=2922238 RepID=A0ABT7LZN0_9CYAN|nr:MULTISPECIES: hypothetical protein [Cyanophyceae]MDK3156612.1 hypothetical protein [Kamptonema cortianum]MDL5050377.1 hypothetical protein [Oscillatoria amoena NRMC-F 0135]MDL5054226.1 hypothetical protein [Oscillatoria laete-virens NRMC-F 0139]MDL5057477.1 hypothetical protein [Geitlerinema calcuttense NRMC-F 0142]
MNIRFSSVSELQHESITESWHLFPAALHPLVLGSGEIGMAVDPTGLQGLNTSQTQMADTLSIMHQDQSTNWNLYLRRDQALSKHHCQKGAEGCHLMPCGWLEYVLHLGNQRWTAREIALYGRNWSRTWTPKTGTLVTSYELNDLRITVTTTIPLDSVLIRVSFHIRNLQGHLSDVRVGLLCHQSLRDGRPLAKPSSMNTSQEKDLIFRQWKANNQSSMADLLEPIALGWTVAAHGPEAVFFADETVIESSVAVVQGRADFLVVAGSDRDGSEGLDYARDQVKRFRSSPPEESLRQSAASWREWFSRGAEVWLGEPDKDYLYLQQQYLLRAGESYHAGIVLGTYWNDTFGGSTFFDSLSVCEGMIRSGHVEEVRRFCQWLTAHCPSEDRPYYHMTYYNGQPAGTGEQAFHVSMAYGGVMIRLWSFTRSMEDARDIVIPYLDRLFTYLMGEKLIKINGEWKMRGSIALDGHLEAESLEAYQVVVYWMAILAEGYLEIKKQIAHDDDLTRQARDFLERMTSRGKFDLSDMNFLETWMPYLMGRSKYVDHASYGEFLKRKFPEGGRPPHDYQPWNTFSFAMSCLLTGFPEQALEQFEDGLRNICGVGYFDESLYEMRGGGFAPYPPATGSYLAVVTNLIVDGDLMSDDISVGTVLPLRWRQKYFRCQHLRTLNGAVISGWFQPDACRITVETNRPRCLRVAVPLRCVGEPLMVRHNGQRVEFPDDTAEIVLQIAAGTHDIEIARDLNHSTDVTIIEPHDHGRKMAQLLRDAGLSVRLLRDYRTLQQLSDKSRGFLVHTSYASLPVEVVSCLGEIAKNGGIVLGLFHSGRLDMDTAFAELSGVRLKQDTDHWNYDSKDVTYSLTDIGQKLFPALPCEFAIPQSADFVGKPDVGVEILAVDKKRGEPLFTRRSVGAGWVYWCAAGNKSADGPQYEFVKSTNEIINHGMDYEKRQKRLWLESPAFAALLSTVFHPLKK